MRKHFLYLPIFAISIIGAVLFTNTQADARVERSLQASIWHDDCRDDVVANSGALAPVASQPYVYSSGPLIQYCLDEDASRLHINNQHEFLYVRVDTLHKFTAEKSNSSLSDLMKDAAYANTQLSAPTLAPMSSGYIDFNTASMAGDNGLIVSVHPLDQFSYDVQYFADTFGRFYVSGSDDVTRDVIKGLFEEFFIDFPEAVATEIHNGSFYSRFGQVLPSLEGSMDAQAVADGLGKLGNALDVIEFISSLPRYSQLSTETNYSHPDGQYIYVRTNLYQTISVIVPPEPNESFNIELLRNKIVPLSDGSSVIMNILHNEYRVISSQADYKCFQAKGYEVHTQLDTSLIKDNHTKGSDALCYVPAHYQNTIFKRGTRSYYIGYNNKHQQIKTQDEYHCLVSHKKARIIPDIEDEYLHRNIRPTFLKPVCFDEAKYNNSIVQIDGASYYINTNGTNTYYKISYEAEYACLTSKLGAKVLGSIEKDYLEEVAQEVASPVCYDGAYYQGNIITIDGDSYYVHRDNSYQWIKHQGDFNCFVSLGSKVRSNVERSYADRKIGFVGGNASCFKAADYSNKVVSIKGSSASYYVLNGKMQHIGSSGVYHCLLERIGVTAIRDVELTYLTDNLTVTPGNVTCHSKAWLKGKMIRYKVGGAYHYVDGSGHRRWVPTSAHVGCLVRRGVKAYTVAYADLVKVPRSKHQQKCWEMERYKNRLVRTQTGTMFFVDSTGHKRWIPTTEAYHCQAKKVGTYLNVTTTTTYRLPSKSQLNCKTTNIRNKIIRRQNGTSYWIDGKGRRYWIPNGSTYNCLRGTKAIHNYATYHTTVSYRYTGTARCAYGKLLNGRIIRNYAGDSHFIALNGTRHWIRNSTIFWQLGGWNNIVNGVSRYAINSIHEGHWAVGWQTRY